jgi:hypothetical protein
MKIIFGVAALSLLAGCATSTGPVAMGKDTYMIAIGGKSLASGGELKAKAYREAGAFCGKQGKVVMPINSSQRDMSYGQDPTAEIQFMCLKDGDPDLQRPVMHTTQNPM